MAIQRQPPSFDRGKALIGLWLPSTHSGHWARFRPIADVRLRPKEACLFGSETPVAHLVRSNTIVSLVAPPLAINMLRAIVSVFPSAARVAVDFAEALPFSIAFDLNSCGLT